MARLPIDRIISDIDKKAQNKQYALALDAYDKIMDKSMSVVNDFYKEYTPTSYKRQYALLPKQTMASTRSRSIAGIVEPVPPLNQKRTVTGVIFCIDNMNGFYYEYHNGKLLSLKEARTHVLSAFLQGYHGPIWMKIHMGSVSPWQQMLQYRNSLIKSYQSLCKTK